MELLRYFGIDELFNKETAPAIWKEANRQLATSDLSVKSILKKENVVFVDTTDDPVDDLAYHAELANGNLSTKVSPSFRPDKGLNINTAGFSDWLTKMGQAAGVSITDYQTLLDAFAKRVDFLMN